MSLRYRPPQEKHGSALQQSISVQFANPWSVRRPYVYRYLDKKYVDQFFDRGTLRLSSYDAFSKHIDEERNDSSEGWVSFINTSTTGKGQTIAARIAKGHESYILCGASVYTAELAKTFGVDSGFRINDPTGFAAEIARHIPVFTGGTEGACIYLPNKMVVRNIGEVDIEKIKDDNDPTKFSVDKMAALISTLAGDDPYFTKHVRYRNQLEYRLLWFTDAPMQTYIDVECPAALKFCTRFEDLYAENSGQHAQDPNGNSSAPSQAPIDAEPNV